MLLPDVLAEDLVVVFCGSDVGDPSAKAEAFYAGRNNKFWSTLFRTHLTSHLLRPAQYALVLAHDIGLMDLVRQRSGMDAELSDDDYDIPGFKRKIAENRPSIVAFNGKETARHVLGRKSVTYGRQDGTIANAAVYVLPSTSKEAHRYWNERFWLELSDEVRRIRRGWK